MPRLVNSVWPGRPYPQGASWDGEGVNFALFSERDIVWLDPSGAEMSEQQWRESFARSLGVFLSGRGLEEQDERGRLVVDSDFLVLVNAHHEALDFRLPAQPDYASWVLRLDTRNAGFERGAHIFHPGDAYPLAGRSLALFEFPLTEVGA